MPLDNDKIFEDFIKSQLNDFEFETPEGGWEKIKQSLPPEPKKRPILIPILANLALFVFTTLGSLFILNSISDKNVKHEVKNIHKETPKTLADKTNSESHNMLHKNDKSRKKDGNNNLNERLKKSNNNFTNDVENNNLIPANKFVANHPFQFTTPILENKIEKNLFSKLNPKTIYFPSYMLSHSIIELPEVAETNIEILEENPTVKEKIKKETHSKKIFFGAQFQLDYRNSRYKTNLKDNVSLSNIYTNNKLNFSNITKTVAAISGYNLSEKIALTTSISYKNVKEKVAYNIIENTKSTNIAQTGENSYKLTQTSNNMYSLERTNHYIGLSAGVLYRATDNLIFASNVELNKLISKKNDDYQHVMNNSTFGNVNFEVLKSQKIRNNFEILAGPTVAYALNSTTTKESIYESKPVSFGLSLKLIKR